MERYFFYLKSLEFDNGNKTANKIQDVNLQIALIQLAEVMYYSGNRQIKPNVLQNQLKDEELDKITKVVRFLTSGYTYLFYDKVKGNAYRSFYDAYNLSIEIGEEFLIKASLLALLKYYNFEIAKNSDAYLPYLNLFKDLAKDTIDEFWVLLYEVIFLSKSLEENIDNAYFQHVGELERYEETLKGNSPLLALLYYEKALMNDIENNDIKAIEYYGKATERAGEIPFLKSVSFFSSIKLAILEMNQNNFSTANEYIEKARVYSNLADSLRSSYYLSLYGSMLYNAQKQHDTAYQLLIDAYEKEFQMDFRRNTLEINRLEVELDTQRKEKQILEEQQKVRANRNWLIAAGITLILGFGIAILLQKNTTKKRLLAEQESQLKQQRVENLLKEQELVSIDAMIEGQEKERQKVANELHDDLGSLMATIKLHFDNSKVNDKDPAMQNAQKLLEEAYQKIRGMAHSKNSGVMSNQGLLPAIKKMASTISETNALKVTVEDFGLGERLENSLELTIFRMVQELVANAIKHAKATKVGIHLTQHEHQLNIIVEDNGSGFDSSKVNKTHNGMGLTTIEKRVEHLEGNFTIDSVLGKGTSILIDIPV
ncbi:sensor histidine kinase [Flagellimonas algicola]|uniref:sensor histidine kinase n=1 Tax=Flagellimonas algicola TaxID=2583815 RepID=UPI0013873372|nr:sensor histidine kinase [Allomuricauda algicola]